MKEIRKVHDGRPRGRTSLYETAEELQAAVDRYFIECKGKPRFDARGIPVTTANGLQIYDYKKRATLSGLSHYLGFKNRQSFTRQKRRGEDFADVVAIARLRCEMQADSFKNTTVSEVLTRCGYDLEGSGQGVDDPDLAAIKAAALQAGFDGKEVRFYIGGRLFAIREIPQ